MAGVGHDAVRETFAVPDSLEPLTALAIGYPGATPELDENIAKRDERERTRRPIDETILAGSL